MCDFDLWEMCQCNIGNCGQQHSFDGHGACALVRHMSKNRGQTLPHVTEVVI